MGNTERNALANFKKMSDFYIKSRKQNKAEVEKILKTSYDALEVLVNRNEGIRTAKEGKDEICPSCGEVLDNDEGQFCTGCGQRLVTNAEYNIIKENILNDYGSNLAILQEVLKEMLDKAETTKKSKDKEETDDDDSMMDVDF